MIIERSTSVKLKLVLHKSLKLLVISTAFICKLFAEFNYLIKWKNSSEDFIPTEEQAIKIKKK